MGGNPSFRPFQSPSALHLLAYRAKLDGSIFAGPDCRAYHHCSVLRAALPAPFFSPLKFLFVSLMLRFESSWNRSDTWQHLNRCTCAGGLFYGAVEICEQELFVGLEYHPLICATYPRLLITISGVLSRRPRLLSHSSFVYGQRRGLCRSNATVTPSPASCSHSYQTRLSGQISAPSSSPHAPCACQRRFRRTGRLPSAVATVHRVHFSTPRSCLFKTLWAAAFPRPRAQRPLGSGEVRACSAGGPNLSQSVRPLALFDSSPSARTHARRPWLAKLQLRGG